MKIHTIFISIVIFLIHALHAYGQTGKISGHVHDAVTSEALPFANVFIDQTTIGTAADETGKYTLSNVPVGESTLVISFVGYKSRIQKIYLKEGEARQLDILLEPDSKQLETVDVKGTRDKEWEAQYRKFDKVFLGDSKFAASSKILNPWYLDFKEGNNLLIASSAQPLEVENMALGYRLFYYLHSMVSGAGGYKITGEVRFEELHPDDARQVKTWNQNRLQAYRGSLRHLMKSILKGDVRQQGFYLYSDVSGYEGSPYRSTVFSEQLNKTIRPFPVDGIVRKGNGEDEYIIDVPPRLEIHYVNGRSSTRYYNDVSYPVSWLEVKEGFLRVNSNGVVLSPPFAVVSGAMYEDRVANLLPYNYMVPDQ